VADEKEDALGPLRRAMGKVASLNKAVAQAKDALEEESRRLGEARKELMSLGRVLIMSKTRPWRLRLTTWQGRRKTLSEPVSRR
jgi:hypothetical protein